MLLVSKPLLPVNVPMSCRCMDVLVNKLQINGNYGNRRPTSYLTRNKPHTTQRGGYFTKTKHFNDLPSAVFGVSGWYTTLHSRTFSTFSTSNPTTPRIVGHSTATLRMMVQHIRPLATSNYNCSDKGGSKEESNTEIVETSKWLTIPNALTFLRMGVSPYIGYLVLGEQFTWALGIFIVAGATDSIDGWIARNFKGQASIIGSYIDPLADKILISVLTLTLTMVHVIPVLLCSMIILRDILLVTTSSHFHYKHLQPPKTLKKFLDFENSTVKMEPTQISKYNTFLQLGLITLSMAAPVFNFLDHPLLCAYWCLVGTTTVISGFSYVWKDKSAYKRR